MMREVFPIEYRRHMDNVAPPSSGPDEVEPGTETEEQPPIRSVYDTPTEAPEPGLIAPPVQQEPEITYVASRREWRRTSGVSAGRWFIAAVLSAAIAEGLYRWALPVVNEGATRNDVNALIAFSVAYVVISGFPVDHAIARLGLVPSLAVHAAAAAAVATALAERFSDHAGTHVPVAAAIAALIAWLVPSFALSSFKPHRQVAVA